MNGKEKFLQSALDCGMKMESQTIAKITDYRKVSEFLSYLKQRNVQLGMDMASLTCSGDVTIVADPDELGNIKLIENDNGCIDCFKFKGLLIMNTDIDDPESAPEMYFEADDDIEWLTKHPEETRTPHLLSKNDGRYEGLEIPEFGPGVFYDKETVDKYMDLDFRRCNGENVYVPKMTRIIRNTRREMLVYANVQGCKKRHRGSSIIYRFSKNTCDDFVEGFSKYYKLI